MWSNSILFKLNRRTRTATLSANSTTPGLKESPCKTSFIAHVGLHQTCLVLSMYLFLTRPVWCGRIHRKYKVNLDLTI